MALAESSDLLSLQPIGPAPTQQFLAQFRCKGLVRENGSIVEADRFVVGIHFPEDYLRTNDLRAVATMLEPLTVYHPNVRGPAICIGAMPGGTSLVDIVYQVFEILSYNRVTMREDDALNIEACAWARANQHRFPVDTRPLKRRTQKTAADSTDDAAPQEEGSTA
jgi:hypothetical protein